MPSSRFEFYEEFHRIFQIEVNEAREIEYPNSKFPVPLAILLLNSFRQEISVSAVTVRHLAHQYEAQLKVYTDAIASGSAAEYAPVQAVRDQIYYQLFRIAVAFRSRE